MLQDELIEQKMLEIEGEQCLITLPARDREYGWAVALPRPLWHYELYADRRWFGFYYYDATTLATEQNMLVVASPNLMRPAYRALLFVVECLSQTEIRTAEPQQPGENNQEYFWNRLMSGALTQQTTRDLYHCRMPSIEEMRAVSHVASVRKLAEYVPVSSRYL